MYVDVRWIVLFAVTALAIGLTYLAPRWAAPITVGVAVAGLVYIFLQL